MTTQLNGWDLQGFQEAIDMVERQPAAGKLTWRSHVDWDAGFGVDARTDEIEQLGEVMRRRFTLRGDHPPELLGQNTGPTAVEGLLAALGSCICGTYAAHATARGVRIEELDVELESRIDLSGMFQLRPVRAGLDGVKATIRVKADADEAVLEEIRQVTTKASPVHDSVSNPVRIESAVERVGGGGGAVTATETRLDRRQLVARAGALAALGSLWDPVAAPARARDHRRERRALFDVACLGDTFAPNFDEALDAANGDMRGAGFFVEGTLYPVGTIPAEDGFDPEAAEPTGLWLCRGWFMFHPGRPLPHVVTTQEYLLGQVSGERPSPADQLVSSGLEGGVRRTVRSVVGGTGRYRRTRGELVQRVIGTNTTVLNEVSEQAPNFRFTLRR